MQDLVTVRCAEGVADVRLNRPDKLNALNQPMFAALVSAGEALAAMPDLRAVVLSGEGRSFCVGIDLAELGAGADGGLSRLADRTHGDCNLFQQAAMLWRRLPVPVIAAVHGHALGGGLQLILGADIRLVASETKLSVREAVWGLVPDMAGYVLLRGLLRDDILRELILTARIFDGTEAARIGVATRVEADPLEAAHTMARAIAALSPDGVQAAKRLANLAAAGASDSALLLAEATEQQVLLASANHTEAVRAGLEKRKPAFAPVPQNTV